MLKKFLNKAGNSTPAVSVNYDPYMGDEQLRHAVTALAGGDVTIAKQVLSSQTPNGAIASEFCDQEPEVPLSVFKTWAEEEPSALTHSLVGHCEIRDAWAIRGSGTADTVSTDAHKGFKEGLRDAKTSFETAVTFEDPWTFNAHIGLIVLARGLGFSNSQAHEHFKNTQTRLPFDLEACGHMLQYLCQKWYGSHDEMYQFADWVSAEAPADSPARIVIPTAFSEDFNQGDVNFRKFFAGSPRSAWVAWNLEQYLQATPSQADNTQARVLNKFARYIIPTDVRTGYMVKECFQRIGNRPTDAWWHRTDSIGQNFEDYRIMRLDVASSFTSNRTTMH